MGINYDQYILLDDIGVQINLSMDILSSALCGLGLKIFRYYLEPIFYCPLYQYHFMEIIDVIFPQELLFIYLSFLL